MHDLRRRIRRFDGIAFAARRFAAAALASALGVAALPSAALAAANVSGRQTSAVVFPGSSRQAIYTFEIANTALLFSITFQGISFQNTTVGPGTQVQRDAEMQLLYLYRDDGDGTFEPGADNLLDTAVPAAGAVAFGSFSTAIPALFPVTFHVAVDPSILARDGDVLDLVISDGSRVQFSSAVAVNGAFPIDPPGGLTVNGMSAAQIDVKAHADTVVTPGARDVLAFDFLVRRNGYENDVLEGLRFENRGSGAADVDVDRIEIWLDGGDGIFDAGDDDDTGLGEADWDGASSVYGLDSIGLAVGASGRRLYAAVRFEDDAALGSSVELALVGPGEKGVVMASANDGPVDAAVPSPRAIRIAPTTIAASAAPQSGVSLRPAGSVVDVFRLTLVHLGGEAETLSSVTFTNTTSGPGTQAQLDAEWASLRLVSRRIPASGGFLALDPQPVGGVSFSGGKATFAGINLVLAPGDSAQITLEGGASAASRDGDFLDLSIASSSDIRFRRTVNASGTYPLAPAGFFPIDGMTAAQIGLAHPGATSLLTGSIRNVVLSLLVPPNGYSPDVLNRLDVTNIGTADALDDLTRLEAWADDGDSLFDDASDARLGEMLYTGDRWQVSGLSRAVPAAGQRVFVTCDVAPDARHGATVRLALQSAPDLAIGMSSTNDGPVDAAKIAPQSWMQSITSVDRVLFSTPALPSIDVAPGQLGVPLLHLLVTNTYASDRTLSDLVVTDATVGPGTVAERDGEFQSLELRIDADGSGDFVGGAGDPLLASSFFAGGRAAFDNFSFTIPAGTSVGLFVTANVSSSGARDGDLLAVHVAAASDVAFAEGATVAGEFPLTSGAACAVDGMVAAQIKSFGAPATTLGPSEGPALALDVLVPANGYASDVLRGVTVVNAGSAAAPDFQEIRLWRDGGNGLFDAGAGDDATLGPLTDLSGSWTSPLLAEPIPAGGIRLFTSITSSAAPTDSASVLLTVPLGGLVVESGNDGPRDAPVANDATQLLSTAALLASIEISPAASVLEGAALARVVVRNAGLATVDAITPSPLVSEGAGVLALVSGPVPGSFSLDPGDTASFDYAFTAAGAGDVRFSGSVNGTEQGSGLTRQSLTTTSNAHFVFVPASGVDLFPVESMPFSINRGQTDVVPLTLTFAHPGGANASPIRVRGLTIALENDLGGGVVPADLLSRIVVSEGATVYLEKTSLEASGALIDLTLTTPVLIDASGANGGQTTLNLALDIADSTLVPNFRIVIADSSSFEAEDAISGAAIDVALQDGSYPIRSGLARVVSEATRLDVESTTTAADESAGLGEDDVGILGVRLVNPDPGGLASDVRLGTFDVAIVDSAGAAIVDPSRFIERIAVRTAFQTLLDRPLAASDDSTLTLVLSPILSIPVNSPLSLTIEVDIAPGSELGTFRARAGAPATFDARDANTGNPVPVEFPSGHPEGPAIHVESPADRALAEGTPRFPTSAPVGESGLAAFDLVLAHPGAAGTADIRCDSLTISLRDDRGAGLVPAVYLDRLRVLRSGMEVGTATTFPASGDEVSIALANVVLEPGASTTLEAVVDFEATAPASFFEMIVAASGIHARDANLGTPTSIEPAEGAELPVRSGIVRIESPSRLLSAASESRMPPVLVSGGSDVAAMSLTLSNPAPLAASTIRVAWIAVRTTDGDGSALPVGAAARSVEIVRDGTTWAAATGLGAAGGSVTLAGTEPLAIGPGETLPLEVRFETADAPTAKSVRFVVEAAGIGVEQPASSLLTIQVQAADGSSFPFRTLAGSFAGSTLRESYSNFPNPFPAGRGETTFAFYLRESAVVKLRILTVRGEEVATLLDDASLAAGLHQDRTWDGRNGRGDAVVNGVYVAELDVRYADGAAERERRKVAVVR